MALVPSICQIVVWPLVFCHRMSDLPSPLKSPVSIACQLGSTSKIGPPVTLVLSISQIVVWPLVFCHRMSDLPSPLKSPVSIACQLGSTSKIGPPVTLVLSISQIVVWPLVFCHRMSDLPSLLKSPVPIACQLGSLLSRNISPSKSTTYRLPSASSANETGLSISPRFDITWSVRSVATQAEP